MTLSSLSYANLRLADRQPRHSGTKDPSADLNKLNSAYRTFVNTRLIYQNRTDCQRLSLLLFFFSFRRFLPFTDEVVRQHLSGRDDLGREFTMGLYPILSDETCYLLAVDLDGDAWQQDAGALRATCQRLGLPVSSERSRSGKGAHLWFFFSEAIPASMARNVGSYLLTETMEGRPDLGLASYDRLFPNQDTMPKGGFGNLIALPLQKTPRAAGNSVFLDEQFQPYKDQWAFLSSVQKIGRAQAEDLAREAERRGRITGVRLPFAEEDEDLPWASPPSRRRKEPPIAGPLPKTLELQNS